MVKVILSLMCLLVNESSCKRRDNMANHIEFALNQIINYLTGKFAHEFEMSKSKTRRYIIDVLSYTIVVEANREYIEFLIEQNAEEV